MKNTLLIFIINLTITPWGVSQNHSISFDGNNDYIAGDFISGDFRTIEFWINADNPINGSTLGTIPINFDSYVRYVAINDFTSTLAGETFSVVGNLGSFTVCNDILTNGWHHIALVASGSTYDQIYIDGSPANMISTNAPLFSNSEVNLGRRVNNQFGSTPSSYSGKLDEFRIWNFAKSQAQISAQMNTEISGNEIGLLVYYKFDENNLSCDVKDCTSAENHGTRFGPNYNIDTPSISDILCGVSTSCSDLDCNENNIFNGTSDNNWDNPNNWSKNCVPVSPISGQITINADCSILISNDESYVFETSSTLIINNSISLTNNGIGVWTMNGTIENNGTYIIPNLTNNGIYKGTGEFIGDFVNNGVISISD